MTIQEATALNVGDYVVCSGLHGEYVGQGYVVRVQRTPAFRVVVAMDDTGLERKFIPWDVRLLMPVGGGK